MNEAFPQKEETLQAVSGQRYHLSLFVPPALKRFQPIKRLGPSPGVLRLVKPITGSDKVVRRYDVVCRI